MCFHIHPHPIRRNCLHPLRRHPLHNSHQSSCCNHKAGHHHRRMCFHIHPHPIRRNCLHPLRRHPLHLLQCLLDPQCSHHQCPDHLLPIQGLYHQSPAIPSH